MTLWDNLNPSEFHCLLEREIKTYKVCSRKLAYRKQLVDVAFMKVRQVQEKQNEMKWKKMPVKQKLGQICTNCGVPFLALGSLSVFWFGPLVLDPSHS